MRGHTSTFLYTKRSAQNATCMSFRGQIAARGWQGAFVWDFSKKSLINMAVPPDLLFTSQDSQKVSRTQVVSCLMLLLWVVVEWVSAVAGFFMSACALWCGCGLRDGEGWRLEVSLCPCAACGHVLELHLCSSAVPRRFFGHAFCSAGVFHL